MREPTRYSLSGALSLLAHALFVLIFAYSLRLEQREALDFSDELPEYAIDFIEFEAKQIEPDEAQGEVEPEPEPEPEPPAEEEAAPPPVEQPSDPEGDKPVPEPDPEPEPPKPKFGEKKSKIKALVPPNATWTLMLANSRIKKLSFRDSATEIMAPLRDFRLLVDDAGFNVWEDFEFIVMGSPDATDQTQAFVAVQYNFGHAEMKAGIERACATHEMAVEWREENDALIGDPRYLDPELEANNPDDRQMVLLPGDKVAVYVREAFIPQVIAGPDSSKGKTSGNFVANVAKMKKYTQAEPKAGVQVVVEDLRSMIRVNGLPFEIPSRAELMWEAAKEPELVIKLDFLEASHAEAAHAYWTEHLETDLRKAGAWDLAGGIIEGTTVERDKRQLVFRHRFNEPAARVVLQLIAGEFGKAMRYSKKEALAAKQRREQNWALREEGKRRPSEVLEPADEPEPASKEQGEAGVQQPATPKQPAQDEPEEPAQDEPEEPAKDEPESEEPAKDEPESEEPASEEPASEEPAGEEPDDAGLQVG
ncbi:MAG: hypothetical protein R6X02_12270 [Enhygromyxa sp.]